MKVLLFFILALVFSPLKSYAYLDLGTGSYMLQLLIATLVGALYALKIYWRKIKVYIKNIISRKECEH